MRGQHRSRARGAALLSLCAAALACAGTRQDPADFGWGETAAEESAPLGGEALAVTKAQMRRTHADLLHFHATLASLEARRDHSGSILFGQFVDAYMGIHLAPLLRGEWQSDHPELAGLDANLRFVQAELLILMRSPHRVEEVIDELERRFEGRRDMIVEYPIGDRGTLADGLERLRERKWRG